MTFHLMFVSTFSTLPSTAVKGNVGGTIIIIIITTTTVWGGGGASRIVLFYYLASPLAPFCCEQPAKATVVTARTGTARKTIFCEHVISSLLVDVIIVNIFGVMKRARRHNRFLPRLGLFGNILQTRRYLKSGRCTADRLCLLCWCV